MIALAMINLDETLHFTKEFDRVAKGVVLYRSEIQLLCHFHIVYSMDLKSDPRLHRCSMSMRGPLFLTISSESVKKRRVITRLQALQLAENAREWQENDEGEMVSQKISMRRATGYNKAIIIKHANRLCLYYLQKRATLSSQEVVDRMLSLCAHVYLFLCHLFTLESSEVSREVRDYFTPEILKESMCTLEIAEDYKEIVLIDRQYHGRVVEDEKELKRLLIVSRGRFSCVLDVACFRKR